MSINPDTANSAAAAVQSASKAQVEPSSESGTHKLHACPPQTPTPEKLRAIEQRLSLMSTRRLMCTVACVLLVLLGFGAGACSRSGANCFGANYTVSPVNGYYPASAQQEDEPSVGSYVGGLVLKFALWVAVWLLMHRFAITGWTLLLQLTNSKLACAFELATSRLVTHTEKVYCRRMLRAQVYYMAASVIGFHALLLQWRDWQRFLALDREVSPSPVYTLLIEWSPHYEIIFIAAAAHWSVTLLEDAVSWKYLAQGMVQFDLVSGSACADCIIGLNPGKAIWAVYCLHHVVTLAVYWYVLITQQLAVLACMGLLFEAPLVLCNFRELLVLLEAKWCWPLDLAELPVRLFHKCVFGLVIICRGGCSAVYFFSLIAWPELLKANAIHLSQTQLAVYHLAGMFFTVLNFYWVILLRAWADEDLKRIGDSA